MTRELSAEQKALIVALAEEGHVPSGIAEAVGIHRHTVYKVLRRDTSAFRHLVDSIKKGHADDSYALASALRDKVWDNLGDVEVKNAGDVQRIVTSAGIMSDKGLGHEGRLPGQGMLPALALFMGIEHGGGDPPQLSEIEVTNLVKQRQEREKLEARRQKGLENLHRDDEPRP